MFSIRRIVVACIVTVVVAGVFSTQAHAVILYRSATRNTSAPTGTNANSGWQWEGNWANGFQGTPIASKYFITAAHLGGAVGTNIWFGNKNHLATAMYDDPLTDLRIYKIADTFTTWAPIYTATTETNKRAMVFGRGTTRAGEVKVGTTLKGWKWGTQDKIRSWGENTVAGSVNGGTGIGNLLKFTFTKGGLTNEGALSGGDSGGGVFINDGGKWKLAGINYLVDGPFSLTSGGATFQASLFDKGGLYNQNVLIPDTAADVAGQWYATRISSRQSWINSVLRGTATASSSAVAIDGVSSVPEPASVSLIGIAAAFLIGRRQR